MDTSNQQRNASRSKLSLRRKKETSPPPKSVSSVAVCAMQPQPLKETLESPSRQDSSGLPRCSVVLRRCAPLKSPMKRDAQSDVRSTEYRQNSPPHGVECGAPTSPCDEDTNRLACLPTLGEEEHASSSFRHTQGKLCVGSSEEIDYPSQTFPRVSQQTSQDPFPCLICKADLSCCSLAEREEHINSCCDKALEKGIEFHSAVEGYETTSHDCPLCERMFPSRQDVLIHSKSCAQVRGIDTAQLIDVLHVQEAEWMNDTTGQSLEKASKIESQRECAVAMDCASDEVKEKVGALSGVPADCDFTKPPLPSAGWTRNRTRKRTRNEPHSYFQKLEKEQLQLAIALSASINPLKEGDENEGTCTISGRTKRPRRTKKAIVVPPLLMTSASQAKSIIAGRADQILCDAAKPHADDDDVPCTPVFAASRLAEAAESTSQEDDDLCSIRELLHGKIGEGTVSDNAASSEKMADAGDHVDEDVHADESPGGVMYDNVSSVLVRSAREVAIKETGRRGGVVLGEDDDRGSVPVTAPSAREMEIARSVASGFDNQEEFCYQTLWQLSHCAENEECSNFYVPALIDAIPPQKIPLHCKVCGTEACLAVMFPRSSCNHQKSEPSPFSDQTTHGINSEAKRFGVPRLLDDLGRLVGSRVLSDVSISTQGGSEIPAHAAILAARCPTLLKELTVSNLPPFRLDFSHHTDATVLAFLEYVYTGNYPQQENEIHWHNFLSLTTELCVEEFKDEASTACTTALITRPSKKLAHCSPATDTMLLNSETQSNSDSNGGFQLIEGIDFGSAAHNTETLLHAGPMHSDVGRLASTSEPHPPQNESKAMPSFRISELPTSPRSCSPELLSGSSAPSSPSSHPLLPTPPPPTSPRYETHPSTARSPSYPPSQPVVQPLFVPPSSPVVVISSPSPEVARQPAAVSPVTSSQPMDMATSSGELTPQEQTSAAVGAPEYCEHSNVLISTCGTILPTHTEGSDSTGESEKTSPDRELDGKEDCIGGSMASRILLDKGPNDLSTVTSDSVQEIYMADASDWYHDEASVQANEVNSPPVVFDSTSTGVDWDREACLLLSDAGGCMQGAQEQDSNGQHHSQETETTPLHTPCCTSRVACPDVIDSPRELNLQAIGSDLTPLHLYEAPSMIKSNLGLYATPTGSRVLLESDDITPMPEYRVMHTPALKSVCSQFGVKHLPKKKMILKLEEIYDYTHPLVDEVGKIVQAPSLLDRTSGEVNRVQAECPERQGTREASKKKTTKTKKVTKKADTSDVDSGCSQSSVEREPAQIVKECISLHPELHRDILLYKPVELSCFQAKLKASGISLSKDKVADALDFLCVTYTQPRGDRPSKKTGRSRDHDTNHPS